MYVITNSIHNKFQNLIYLVWKEFVVWQQSYFQTIYIETILWISFYVFSNSIIQSLCYQSQKSNCPYYPLESDKNIFESDLVWRMEINCVRSSRKAWLLITIFAILSSFLLPSFLRREEIYFFFIKWNIKLLFLLKSTSQIFFV